MKATELLVFIIEDGIEAARRDYTKPQDRIKLEGSIRGFEECRVTDLRVLSALLKTSATDAETRLFQQAPDYWYWRCRHLEIQWVCNVISAALWLDGLPVLMPPTHRGFLKFASIVGEVPDLND